MDLRPDQKFTESLVPQTQGPKLITIDTPVRSQLRPIHLFPREKKKNSTFTLLCLHK